MTHASYCLQIEHSGGEPSFASLGPEVGPGRPREHTFISNDFLKLYADSTQWLAREGPLAMHETSDLCL